MILTAPRLTAPLVTTQEWILSRSCWAAAVEANAAAPSTDSVRSSANRCGSLPPGNLLDDKGALQPPYAAEDFAWMGNSRAPSLSRVVLESPASKIVERADRENSRLSRRGSSVGRAHG